ncbi:MAG: hypothetical protein KKI08_00215 [Armatimonadetes bacterium]|nr:hypothetical protein [Armatimonadota bacterium]
MPGAPPHVVWLIGIGLIVMAGLIVAAIVAIALWLRDEARYNGRSPTLWFVLGLIGGWVTAIVWLLIRDRDWNPIDYPYEYRTSRGNAEATPPETEE